MVISILIISGLILLAGNSARLHLHTAYLGSMKALAPITVVRRGSVTAIGMST